MLNQQRRQVQLKDDIQQCIDSLKENADSFKNVAANVEQVLRKIIAACDVHTLDGPQLGARPVGYSRGLLTVKEIAAYLGVCDRSIYLWIKRKNFPYRRVGDDLRFDLKEVEAWTTPKTKALEKAPLHVVE